MELVDVQLKKVETIYATVYQPVQVEYWRNRGVIEVKFCDPAQPEVKYDNATDLFQVNRDIIYEALEELDYSTWNHCVQLSDKVRQEYYKEIEQQYGSDLFLVTAGGEENFFYPIVRKVKLENGAIIDEQRLITTRFTEHLAQIVKDKPLVNIDELCHIISAEDLQEIVNSHKVPSLELCQ